MLVGTTSAGEALVDEVSIRLRKRGVLELAWLPFYRPTGPS